MTLKFQPGTVVQLKSGGPLMTVAVFSETYGQYFCEWFDKSETKNGYFYETSLKEYFPEENSF